jgi:hypothetical protein
VVGTPNVAAAARRLASRSASIIILRLGSRGRNGVGSGQFLLGGGFARAAERARRSIGTDAHHGPASSDGARATLKGSTGRRAAVHDAVLKAAAITWVNKPGSLGSTCTWMIARWVSIAPVSTGNTPTLNVASRSGDTFMNDGTFTDPAEADTGGRRTRPSLFRRPA